MTTYNSILPNYGWATPAPRTVVETIEYDDKGRIVKRTTTTTETQSPSTFPRQTFWNVTS